MKIDYRPGLDGLRAVAVVLVLVFHSGLGWLPGGFLGVSVFFTLSGFLITSLLVAEMDAGRGVDLIAFWERRFRRLLPAALVTISGVSLTGIWLATEVEQSRLRGDAIASVFYMSNWRSIVSELSYEDIFSTRSPLVHLWSLAIEEQMYVLLPIVVVGVLALGRGRRAVGYVALALASVSAVLGVFVVSGDRLYYGTDARAVELLVGVAIAALFGPTIWGGTVRMPRFVAWIPMLALAGIVGLARLSSTDSDWVYSGLLGAFALLSLACVVGALLPGPLQRLLSIRALVHIGKRSYGLYLYHWPIFTWMNEDRIGIGGVGLFTLQAAVTAVVASLSYALVEKPIRERRFLPTRRSFVFVMLSAIVVTLAIPVALLRTVSGEPTSEVRVLSTIPPTASPTVVAGPVRAERFLVIGDSTAENVARALASVDSIGVVSAGVLGCPLVTVAEVFDRPRASQETSYCPDNVDIVRRHASEVDVVLIVGGVSNQWSYRSLDGSVVDPGSDRYRRDFDELMESMQAVLASSGVPVIVLDNPRTRSDGAVLGDEVEVHAAWREQIARWDEEWETVVRVSIDDALAPADSSEGRIQRPDGVHLEEEFAAELARSVLVPRLEVAYGDMVERLNRIGCRIDDEIGIRFDLDKCRGF